MSSGGFLPAGMLSNCMCDPSCYVSVRLTAVENWAQLYGSLLLFETKPWSQPDLFGNQLLHDFRGAAADRQDFGIPVQALHHRFPHEAHAAEQLHRLASDFFAHVDGEVLGHGHLFDRVFAGLHQRRAAVGVFPGDVDLGGHVHQLVAVHLEACNRAAEGLGLSGVIQSGFVGDLGGHVGHDGQAQAFSQEVAHDGDKAGVFGADQAVGRYLAVLEEEFGGVAGPPAHFPELVAGGEAGGAFVDQQQADAAVAFAPGAHGDGIMVGADAAGDEGFAAVDDVVVAVFYGTGFQVGNVRAATGFGNRQGGNFFAPEHRRYDLFPNFLLRPLGHRRQADIQGADTGHEAARGGSHQFLGNCDFHKNIAFTDAAQSFREADAQESGVASELIDFAGEFTGLFPVVDMGQYVGFDKFTGGQTNLFVGFVEVVRHNRASCVLVGVVRSVS